MTTPIITVKHLYKEYNGFVAVNKISFEVYKGEIFGLLGTNGAGKTTTLEIMETLRNKTLGEVLIDGLSIDNDSIKIKSIIGIQLQQSGFYPNLSLSETIKLFSGLYGINVDADELLNKVNLRDKSKSRVDTLSGGQKQRFSICITLINKPKIIFLDEPTTGLDPQARRNLWRLIKEIKDAGTTIIITTHYMDEAEILCDRIAILDKGDILKLDTPNNLINNLIKNGFKKKLQVKQANLEDVFINLTGKEIKDE